MRMMLICKRISVGEQNSSGAQRGFIGTPEAAQDRLRSMAVAGGIESHENTNVRLHVLTVVVLTIQMGIGNITSIQMKSGMSGARARSRRWPSFRLDWWSASEV